MTNEVLIRNFPESLHREIKVASAQQGVPMYKLIIQILTEWIERRTSKEV